jgi:cell wall-associated NlpC family hydrolase
MTLTTRLLLVLAMCATALPASAQDGAGPLAAVLAREVNSDGPFAKREFAARDLVVQRARAQLGRRYQFASSSPDRGFDCSGLAKYVLEAVGVELPHNAARIAQLGVRVEADPSALRAGDLLLFGRGRSARITHVGIYVGDGKMIHASTSQRRVVETQVPYGDAALNLRLVRRVLRDSTTVSRGSD